MKVREIISFRVDKDTLSFLEELSSRLGCSKSEIIRIALREYIFSLQNEEIELLANKYKEIEELRRIKEEGKREAWKAFFKSRFKRIMIKAISNQLNVEDLIKIAESYRKEAEITNKIKDFEIVMKLIFAKMKDKGLYSIDDIERLKQYFGIYDEDWEPGRIL